MTGREKIRTIVMLFGLLVVIMPVFLWISDLTNIKIFTIKEYWIAWLMFMAAVFLIIQKGKEKTSQ